MTHHWFAHRGDAVTECRQQAFRVHTDLVMFGGKVTGDDVGVLELVTGLIVDRFETDRERIESALALFGEQADDQAGVEPT